MVGTEVKCTCCPDTVLPNRAAYAVHVKLPWHCFNSENVMMGRKPVSEAAYDEQHNKVANPTSAVAVGASADAEPETATAGVSSHAVVPDVIDVVVVFSYRADTWSHKFSVARGSTVLALKRAMVLPGQTGDDAIVFDLQRNFMRVSNYETIDQEDTFRFWYLGPEAGRRWLERDEATSSNSREVPIMRDHVYFAPFDINGADEVRPAGAVIWLHGFTDSPDSWVRLLAPVRTANPSWKWCHLRAPSISITCYNAVPMLAWGDFVDAGAVRVGSGDHDDADPRGAYAASVAAVHQCVASLEAEDGVPPDRVVIGGFSQGATVAIESALRYHSRVAGCVFLSGWMLPSGRAAVATSSSRGLPCLVCHGLCDTQVDPKCGELAASLLSAAGSAVRLKLIPGVGHECRGCGGELVEDFLRSVLPDSAPRDGA